MLGSLTKQGREVRRHRKGVCDVGICFILLELEEKELGQSRSMLVPWGPAQSLAHSSHEIKVPCRMDNGEEEQGLRNKRRAWRR